MVTRNKVFFGKFMEVDSSLANIDAVFEIVNSTSRSLGRYSSKATYILADGNPCETYLAGLDRHERSI